MDAEKRIRREIANSNERRRMQSINAGFNSLRTMLPKHDGEKLSKAAILQHTAEYIDSLEQEKTRLLSQHHQLKRLISSIINGQQDISDLAKHSLVKKIKTEHNSEFNSDSSDEGIHCNVSPLESFDNVDELKAELIEVRKTVDKERKLRMQLEDQVKTLETQLYPERVKEIAHSVQTKLNHGGRHHHSSSLQASASETGSLDNSENENETAVASLVDDVIAETIEIESGSCPGSPISTTIGSHPTIVIQQSASSTNGTSIGPIASHIIHLDTTTLQRAVAAASSSKGSSGKSSGQPAAIALPIEVPFMGGLATVAASPTTVSKGNNGGTVHHTNNSSKTNSTGANTNTSNIQAGTTSTPAGAKSAGTSASNVVTTRVSSVIVSNTNSNSSNNSNNGKDSGKNATSNGNVTTNSDGKSASVNSSNSTSNKSSASTTSSSTKSSKHASVVGSQTRHNLETIVEAIRHLEGDHMFKDDDSVAIEVEEEVEVPLTEGETIIATTIERK